MTGDTRTELLREAERLMRTRGYSGFSYADLAEKVSIRKASVHHHFPTKESLGLALVEEYMSQFSSQLDSITESDLSAPDKIRAYAGFFEKAVAERQLPLCGALAAEIHSMPDNLGDRTNKFFCLHVNWLVEVIKEGIGDGHFRPELDTENAAMLVLSLLEGASLVAWVLQTHEFIPTIIEMTLDRMFLEEC